MDKTNVTTLKISSLQDYLERLLMLSKEKKNIRNVDLANKLNYSKASVSVALKKLKEEGYVLIDEKGFITLTPNGLKIAEFVLDRHINLTKLFVQLGVQENIANDDACKIEHIISNETYLALKKLIKQNKSV